MKAPSKTLIVGAGGGGIASALLASLRGENVTLIEGHSKLGGCASWFKRGAFVFDAGATTVSGVASHEPLGELFSLLGAWPSLIPSDPGITFHLSNGKVIRYNRDFEKWMGELERSFPHLDHRPFWKKIRKINQMSWELLRDVKTFPFRSFSDILPVLKHPRYIKLIPHLLVSTEMALKSHGLYDESYLELVNGIMIISAQGEARDIPFIVGAMALSYPAETYAPLGGMKGLMDFFKTELEKRNVELLSRTKVVKTSESSITLQDGSVLEVDRIILNVPVWNIAELSGDQKFSAEASGRPGHWGALTVYFGIEGNIQELYHQIHLKGPVDNYFVSFSIPDDELRAPKGFQAVTISTHVKAQNFSQHEREKLSEIIIQDFKKRFQVQELKYLTTGAPKTFERYTGRKTGFVGGLPFLYGKNPISLLSPLTHMKKVFRVGDTVFPGQGLCGVVAGALELDYRLR